MSAGQYRNSTSLPGLYFGKTFAPGPVWKGSRASEDVKFQRYDRKQQLKAFNKANQLEQRTRGRHKDASGFVSRQDGIIGRAGLLVMRVLTFDFLNYASGRLDPSYEAIAIKANLSIRSVARALVKLRAAGVLRWVQRRVGGIGESGRYEMHQETNAYYFQHWKGWKGWATPPPAPEKGTTGEHPPLPEALEAAADAARDHDRHGMQRALEGAQPGTVGASLAQLGRLLYPRS